MNQTNLGQEIPYDRPPFEELNLSQAHKLNPSRPAPAAFVIGLHPLLQPSGQLTHLALSHTTEIQEVNNWEDVIEVLCSPDGKYFIYATYEGSTIDAILRFLPAPALIQLATDGYLTYQGCQLWYTPDHKLTILRQGEEARIQVLRNWSRRLALIDACARAGVSLAPISGVRIEAGALSSAEAMTVARGIKLLGDKVRKRVGALIGSDNYGDISIPGNLTKGFLSRDMPSDSLPPEVTKMAYDCLHAPWIEMLSQGYFNDVYDYDIDSAYPNEVAKLITVSEKTGEWIHSNDLRYLNSSAYGFAHAIIDLLPMPGGASPIRFRKKTGKLFSPYGTWTGYITKPEIDFIHRHDLGTVEILDGWWFVASEYIRPFLKTVEHLITMRRSAKDPVLKAISKSIAVRISGYFLQKFERINFKTKQHTWYTGPLFHPVYACEVMTQTKIRLAEMALEVESKGGRILSLTVDGLVSTRPLPRQSGRKLVVRGPIVLAAPLIMHLDKRYSRINLLRALWKNPEASELKVGEPRRIPLTEALLMHSPNRIAELQLEPLTLEIGKDVTRLWRHIPTKGRDLLYKGYHSTQPYIEYALMGEKRASWENAQDRS